MTTTTMAKPTIRRKKHDVVLENFMEEIARRNAGETEFIQAVQEVAETLIPFIQKTPKYKGARLLERICEPERMFIFRVPWMDDKGDYQINRGYRIQMNSAIGPYKGGLRLHPSVNQSILKFLAFEQIFKNSLTTLPLGAGKGGADFDPKGRSNNEVMRFCQSYMTELSKYIGANVDIPAGDIGTGSREIGYMFGQYKRLQNEFVGVLTGKDYSYGGSLIRPEATGFGSVYFADEMLRHSGDSLEGKTAVISGSGNVAQFTARKLIDLGAKVVSFSDSSGFIHDPDGVNEEKLQFVMELKNSSRGRISEYAREFKVKFYDRQRPWVIPTDLAFPSATQNELDQSDAETLIKNNVLAVTEGANMPCTPDAVTTFLKAGVLFGPGKAANAGGVAVSGLEMSQNSQRISWSMEEVDQRLHNIMRGIHSSCVTYGAGKKGVNYVKGANIAGFVKVADAMLAQGLV